jgi:hypothetical protein
MKTLERRLTEALRSEAEGLPDEVAAHFLSPIAPKRTGSMRPSLAATAAVVAVMILAAPLIWLNSERSGGPLTPPTPSTSEADVGTIPRWPPVSILPGEFFLLVEDCLQQKGFAPVVDPEAHTIGFTDSQPGSDWAKKECINDIDPTYLEPPPPFTEEQLADLYLYVTDQRDCYVELGYSRVEMPSRTLFETDLRGRFDPAGELASTYGEFPTDEDLATCRSRSRPYWFVGS